VKVYVQNRLVMELDQIPKLAANALREQFEHSNPEFYKKRGMGFRSAEPHVI
jgi:hypothetical protein